jgi:hypothetical protein
MNPVDLCLDDRREVAWVERPASYQQPIDTGRQ